MLPTLMSSVLVTSRMASSIWHPRGGARGALLALPAWFGVKHRAWPGIGHRRRSRQGAWRHADAGTDPRWRHTRPDTHPIADAHPWPDRGHLKLQPASPTGSI